MSTLLFIGNFSAMAQKKKDPINRILFIFDASHPRPQTPSVGWIKILPSFSQFDAAAGDKNSFKLIY